MPVFRDSWGLTRTSFRMLWENPALLYLPLLAAGALLATVLVVVGPVVAAFLWEPAAALAFAHTPGGAVTLLVLFLTLYVALVFVGNLFYAALIAVATDRLNGRTPTIRDGLKFARARAVRIFLWSLVGATVGLAIRAISARFRGAGGLLLGLVAGATWGMATYFILPVILYEDGGPFASLKRSASLFVGTFGRTLLTNLVVVLLAVGLGVAGLVLVAVGAGLVLGAGPVVLGVVLLLAGVAVWMFTAVLVAALEGVLLAALYRYATTGRIAADIIPYEYRAAAPRP